jgi:hypothetical protein
LPAANSAVLQSGSGIKGGAAHGVPSGLIIKIRPAVRKLKHKNPDLDVALPKAITTR